MNQCKFNLKKELKIKADQDEGCFLMPWTDHMACPYTKMKHPKAQDGHDPLIIF